MVNRITSKNSDGRVLIAHGRHRDNRSVDGRRPAPPKSAVSCNSGDRLGLPSLFAGCDSRSCITVGKSEELDSMRKTIVWRHSHRERHWVGVRRRAKAVQGFSREQITAPNSVAPGKPKPKQSVCCEPDLRFGAAVLRSQKITDHPKGGVTNGLGQRDVETGREIGPVAGTCDADYRGNPDCELERAARCLASWRLNVVLHLV